MLQRKMNVLNYIVFWRGAIRSTDRIVVHCSLSFELREHVCVRDSMTNWLVFTIISMKIQFSLCALFLFVYFFFLLRRKRKISCLLKCNCHFGLMWWWWWLWNCLFVRGVTLSNISCKCIAISNKREKTDGKSTKSF